MASLLSGLKGRDLLSAADLSREETLELLGLARRLKAGELGMRDTLFVEPTGLSSGNVSTSSDLTRLVRAAALKLGGHCFRAWTRRGLQSCLSGSAGRPPP